MKSTLLLVACIVLVILAIKRYTITQEHKNITQAKPVQQRIIKEAYNLLPEEIKLQSLRNY